METWKGRPEISGADHPTTIYRALLGSFAIWHTEMPEEDAFAWKKIAQDAYGSLQDTFGIIEPEAEPLIPDGKTVLYMSLDQLELALVAHGNTELEKPATEDAQQEVARVDELLKAIDSNRVSMKTK